MSLRPVSLSEQGKVGLPFSMSRPSRGPLVGKTICRTSQLRQASIKIRPNNVIACYHWEGFGGWQQLLFFFCMEPE